MSYFVVNHIRVISGPINDFRKLVVKYGQLDKELDSFIIKLNTCQTTEQDQKYGLLFL